MWPERRLFHKHGFGHAVVHGGSIAAWCTAEYVSARKCGVGIETAEPSRRQGFGTAAAIAFITHCDRIGLTPHWDTWVDNAPSVGLAEKCGFELVEEGDVHEGRWVAEARS